MKYILWAFTLLGALLGGLVIIFTIAAAKGAPQEAAGYAMACALAVVPYVFTKAALAISAASRKESTDRIVQALHSLQSDVLRGIAGK